MTSSRPSEEGAGHDGSFVLMLAGDVALGENYASRPSARLLRSRLREGHCRLFDGVADLLSSADMVVANLETPLASKTDPALLDRKRYLHWSNPEQTANALRHVGVTAVSLANNHMLDCGVEGLLQTGSMLDKAGVAWFGAGATGNVAALPFQRTVRVGNMVRTIVIFGCFERRRRYDDDFGWYAADHRAGVNPINPANIAIQIEKLRTTVANPIFIAFPHWGEDYKAVNEYQHLVADRLIEAGADLVIGHGTHIIQPTKVTRGRLVVFGGGNFVFNSPGRFRSTGCAPFGQILSIRLTSAGDVRLRLYPLLTDNRLSAYRCHPLMGRARFERAAAVMVDDPDFRLSGSQDQYGFYLDIPSSQWQTGQS